MANKLELTWYGKDEPIRIELRLLIEDAALSNTAADPDTENMLIHGDNLLALKALESKYAGQVKCIYIDPPYNTGSAFEHYDDNLEHSQWLNLMRPRLDILWRLLSDEGSLWTSIDDDEQAYMKVLCDGLFGRASFVASIIWQKRTSPDMRAVISDDHDYILVYAKDKEQFKRHRNRLPLSEEQRKNYKNPDNDPRGPWTSTDCTAQAGHGTAEQFYTLTTPSGRVIELPKSLCWRFTKERMEEEIAAGRIWLGKDGLGVPRKKTYLKDSTGIVPWTLWMNKEVGHNQEAKKEINIQELSEQVYEHHGEIFVSDVERELSEKIAYISLQISSLNDSLREINALLGVHNLSLWVCREAVFLFFAFGDLDGRNLLLCGVLQPSHEAVFTRADNVACDNGALADVEIRLTGTRVIGVVRHGVGVALERLAAQDT